MPRDAIGHVHARAGDTARIVSLVPSITELLFELGLGGQVVGRTGFCVHPREAVRRVSKVGGTKDVDLAAVGALAPTHVIVNVEENTRETFDALARFVPSVVVTHPRAPRDNPALYRLLGELFGREREAAELARAFDGAFTRLRDGARTLPRRRVLYLVWRDPWIGVAPGTYIASTLALVNWICATPPGPADYPRLEAGDFAALGVDRVLLSSEPYPFRAKHLGEVAALVGERAPVSLIDGEMVSWYGSRAIRGLDYLAAYARDAEVAAA